MEQEADLIIVGGGAAGFFGGINFLQRNPNSSAIILELGKTVLNKVRISGGGRCNVLHAEYDPTALVKAYPRGEKELRGPFSRFCTGDAWEWFETQGVPLKIEEDGRVFPESNSSETIVNCLLDAFTALGGKVLTGQKVHALIKKENLYFLESVTNTYKSSKILWATGGTESSWKLLESFGIPCKKRVPSLFSFNIPYAKLTSLSGISVANATVTLPQCKSESNGPLLITHWGISGPAVLKQSAQAALELAELTYNYDVAVNWAGIPYSDVLIMLQEYASKHPSSRLNQHPLETLPKRLWQYLLLEIKLEGTTPWQHLSQNQITVLSKQITASLYQAKGKTTYKEEFVTAGGIDTSAVNMKTLELKDFPGFYVAGEVLNIDGITGGFNFQNAWTTSWVAAQNI